MRFVVVFLFLAVSGFFLLAGGGALAQTAVNGESRSLTVQGKERSYLLYKPAEAVSGKRYPVIIVLHGGGGGAVHTAERIGMTEKAVPRGFMVAYPNGSGRFERMKLGKTWNATHCCGHAMENGVDDIGFISALIDDLVAHDMADSKRVYVTGLSNGGMMTNQIGAKLSGKVAAIAPVISSLFGDEPSPARAVPALIINGADDDKILVGGGLTTANIRSAWDGTPMLPVASQGDFWAKANNCSGVTERVDARTEAKVWTYSCPTGKEVERLLVSGMGHEWPGTTAGGRETFYSGSFNATDAIIDFFSRH